jgi:hypothetical protein
MTCHLCKQPAEDSLEFETGNNAEYGVVIDLCAAHLVEYGTDEYVFQDKYAEQILEALYESWRGQADYLKE